MLATSLSGTTTITNAATEPHVQDLCSFLNQAGAKITGIGSSVLSITGPSSLVPSAYSIIPDHYEIGTFLALGALTGEKFVSPAPSRSIFGLSIGNLPNSASALTTKKIPLLSKKARKSV